MRGRLASAALLVAATAASPAAAGIYSDDLGKCLVAKTTDGDKAAFMRWMFGAMSASPVVSDLASVSAARRADLDAKAGALFQRLVVLDCHAETVMALKYEGGAAFESAFSVLGQVAGRGLMSDPALATDMGNLAKAMDREKLSQLWKEAGLPPAAPANAPK